MGARCFLLRLFGYSSWLTFSASLFCYLIIQIFIKNSLIDFVYLQWFIY